MFSAQRLQGCSVATASPTHNTSVRYPGQYPAAIMRKNADGAPGVFAQRPILCTKQQLRHVKNAREVPHRSHVAHSAFA